MNSKAAPLIIAAVIVVIVSVGVFAWSRMSGAGGASGDKPPAMPASVSAEFQKRMGSAAPTGPQAVPGGPAPATAGGGYVAPPLAPGGH